MLVSFVVRETLADRPISARDDSVSIALDGRRRARLRGGDRRAERPDNIGPQERARLLGRYGRRFVAGEAIFQEGTPAQEAFLLQEGRVRLFKRVAMTDRSLAVIKPGTSSARARCSRARRTGRPRSRSTDGRRARARPRDVPRRSSSSTRSSRRGRSISSFAACATPRTRSRS